MLLFLAALVIFSLLAPPVHAQEATSSANLGPEIIDQQQTTGTTKEDFDNGEGQWLAQTFTVSTSGQLTKVTLSLDRNNSSNGDGDVSLQLRSTVDATPSATILATTATPSANLNQNGGQDRDFLFSSPAAVDAGQSYALVVFRSGSGTITTNYNWYRAAATGNNNPYPLGQGFISGNSGTSWTLRNSGNGDHRFITYIRALLSSSSGSTSGSGSPEFSAVGPPTCHDTKPGSTPTLLSAEVAGENQVKLTWAKASGSVSYYLITYGTSAGLQQYGHPNVGDSNTTSFIIKGLSTGKAYYFKVRAGNGCTPGDFSNELSAKPTGQILTSPAVGFIPGVLGTATASGEVSEVGENFPLEMLTSEPQQNSSDSAPTLTNIAKTIFNFLRELFFNTLRW